MDWQKELKFHQNPAYLKTGNQKQQQVYHILKNKILPFIPGEYHPTLAGTIPIGIDTDESDIDLICESNNHDEFHQLLKSKFSHFPHFEINRKNIRTIDSIICRFETDGFKVEIFGQPIEVVHQNAFRHMAIERKILEHAPHEFATEIVKLKSSGLSTEEAFVKILRLKGDPYDAILTFDDLSKIKRIDWKSQVQEN
jgi:hypothetical protein